MIENESKKDWKDSSLEEFFRDAVKYGRVSEIMALIRCLPDDLKRKYKAIYEQEKAKR